MERDIGLILGLMDIDIALLESKLASLEEGSSTTTKNLLLNIASKQ